MYTSIDELQQAVTGALRLDGNTIYVTDGHALRETNIDPLVFTAVFAVDPALKTQARSVIRHLAAGLGILSSSLRQYYLAIGRGEVPETSTVPAINLRTLTYDIARVLFKLKQEQHIGPLIVELARSEMGYTNQQIAAVQLDFSVLENTGRIAREKYRLGGVVQHGASTLPIDVFDQFPKHHTLEIHLATGFQNIIYDQMPAELREYMYLWLVHHCQDEWQAELTREQFLYKTRKKAFGPFKQELWELSEQEKQPILDALEQQFSLLFEKLNIFNTKEVVERYM